MAKYGVVNLDLDNHNKIINYEFLQQGIKNKLLSGNVIYIYHSDKTGQVYIGQTKHFISRHTQHYSGIEENFIKIKFNKVLVVYSSLFHGSALDDVERQLIMYFKSDYEKKTTVSFDFQEVVNKTNGNYVNEYKDQEKVLFNVLVPLWENELRQNGLVNAASLKELKSSVLTKYSPIKSLTIEQEAIIDKILTEPDMNFVINGDAGTGKTVILTHLVARLLKENPGKRVAVVVPPNWERIGKEIFNVYGFPKQQWDVVTSTKLITSGEKYDYIVVDESHKLSRRGNKQHPTFNSVYKKPGYENLHSHLEIIQRVGKQIILMYDVLQGIRPANISRHDYRELTKNYNQQYLSTQFRIKAPKGASYTSEDYVNGIKWLLYKDMDILHQTNFNPDFNRDVFKQMDDESYFGYYTEQPLKNLIDWIEHDRNLNSHHTNRVLGGLVEYWAQKDGKDSKKYHWIEGDIKRRWNSTQENWIDSDEEDAEDQIGSVFAVQGIDLNKVGVLLGDDLGIDEKGQLYAVRENFHNVNGVFSVDEAFTDENKKEFTLFVLNIYYVLLTRGIDGIRIGFWKNDELFDYFEKTLLMDEK